MQASGVPGGPPSRTNTPPRSGGAPIRLLRICMDERVLGGIEVSESSTLADARLAISEDEIPSVPDNYLFLFGGAPVSRQQEGRRRAVDCFPFLMIIPENSRVPPDAGEQAGRAGEPPAADAGQADNSGASTSMNTSGVQALRHQGSSASTPAVAESEAGERGDVTIVLESDTDDVPSVLRGVQLELQITDGPLEGTMVTVGEEGARIGRHTSNTLVIPEAGISRYHCEICYADGEFCVRDLGSTTGTFFYLRPQAQFQMFPGLMVKLGETEFQVLSQSSLGMEAPEQLVWFYEGPLAGHKAHVPPGGITIGRRHNNTLPLAHDGTVSG